MNVGGQIDDHTRVITRLVGLLAPVFVGFYGCMVALGYAPVDHFAGVTWLVVLVTAWIAYGIWQYFWPPRWVWLPVFTIGLYHVLGSIFLITISGFSSFVICSWAILALAAYLYYSATGYTASLVVLAIAAIIDQILHPGSIYDTALLLLGMLGVVLLSGSAAMILHAYQIQGRSLRTAAVPYSADHQKLLTIINNLADAVLTTNRKGMIEQYNAAALSLLDTNTDITNKSIDSVLAMRDSEGQEVSIVTMLHRAKHVETDDTLLYGNADDPLRFELTYAPIRSSYKDGDIGREGYIVIARDITKAKSLEEERDEFISVVSHELRTPVTVAEGSISNAQLLLERGKDTKAKLADALTEAHDQVVFLAGMINDLSTLSRAERGVASELETIDVTSFVHDLYNEYSPQAEKKKLHLNLSVAPNLGAVETSRLYLHELLQNLITNALKYTNEGSVTLEAKKNADTIEFSVSDTGIGISKSDQAKIFNKFYRSEDYRTRETNGTGLGLYVAAKLAKKLGTQISVKSRINHGSHFSITLPKK
ncbi:PAS domain-containing protein [Candidatus Saccharibacteria bacterium]|nr:PAS domain-containing protein [Candidatus Saccharibacteria bacterium]